MKLKYSEEIGHRIGKAIVVWCVRFTLTSSGSHESRVKERTLEKWTPRLLQRQKEKAVNDRMCMIIKKIIIIIKTFLS